MLSRLASKTPNIHSARINVPILFSNADSGSSFNWSTLASQWSKLTTLSLSDLPSPYINETYDISNISDVFHRLQHLDITRCDGIRTHMLPTMPYLQTLAACIDHASDYNALPKILQSCQNTLHTLFIRFECYDDRAPPNSFNLDDLNIGHKQLKTFGLYSMDGSQFNITEFGDNLEHLGWCVHNFLEMDPSLPPAMIKKDTLKSLSFAGNMDPDCAALVLEANKYSLQTLYFEDTDLIDALQESKVRLYNVTTLCCISSSLENSDVCSLAEIFPNVKYLALCRKKYPTLKGTGRPMWIAMDSLSHFQHLEALDIMTFLELVDQSLSTFQQCKILGPVWKGPYLVIPLQESRGRYLCHMFH
ncbi:hypothetical protein INT44_003066 [Umbelopsis vinacea]|uniref:Uncharacterized protein n=1 Tax=Umbelopsis vinacea TaxID=44442 RepID=A0A8H7Q7P8_9FUNG|nr:hypothetical protein INT44_003066 [Umbelopsis vinacea]